MGFARLSAAAVLALVSYAGAEVAVRRDATPPDRPRRLVHQGSVQRSPLQIHGADFVIDGTPFEWRGISAFRLVEMEAHGRHADVVRYLDWAAAHHLTVVRVFTMARHLFDLTPADGLKALPAVLAYAEARRIHVEVVALADTAAVAVDLEAHVKAVGAIALQHPNAILEIANEPAHPTQRAEVHDTRVLERLRTLIPAGVPVALGSAEENGAYAGGNFATMHFPRAGGASGWGHVLALAQGAALVRSWGKPVVNDEPIGAAEQSIPGRRDNVPARFRAAALLTRLTGMGATFHYEGGLQGRIPSGRELQCFTAWNSAWELLEAGAARRGAFQAAGEPGAAVTSYSKERAAGVFERRSEGEAWVLAIGLTGDPALQWGSGWKPVTERRLDGVWLVSARRATN